MRGPKSVMAPTPMKIRQGYTPALTPIYRMSSRPPRWMMSVKDSSPLSLPASSFAAF